MTYLTPEINKIFSLHSKQINIVNMNEDFFLLTTYKKYSNIEPLSFNKDFFLFVPQDNKIVYKKDIPDSSFNIGLTTLRAYKSLLSQDYKKFGEQLLINHNLEWQYIEDNAKINIEFLNMLGNGAWGGRICSNGFVFICPPDKRESIICTKK